LFVSLLKIPTIRSPLFLKLYLSDLCDVSDNGYRKIELPFLFKLDNKILLKIDSKKDGKDKNAVSANNYH
jgi:hypothetical protein